MKSVCTRRCSYKTTSFEIEQPIAWLLNVSQPIRINYFTWNNNIGLYAVFRKFKRSYDASQNLWRTLRAQSIYFGISPVVKQNHPLPISITCLGVVLWCREWNWFLSNVSQPMRINYLTWKYNIFIHHLSCSNQ